MFLLPPPCVVLHPKLVDHSMLVQQSLRRCDLIEVVLEIGHQCSSDTLLPQLVNPSLRSSKLVAVLPAIGHLLLESFIAAIHSAMEFAKSET